MKFTKSALMLLSTSATSCLAFAPRAAKPTLGKIAGSQVLGRNFVARASAPYSDTTASVFPDMIENDEFLSTYNQQVTNELSASQLYLSASLWCERQELVGMAAFMRRESDEEREHATKFIDFANKRRMPLQLQTLPAPPSDWDSVTDLWKDLLASEEENTRALKKLGAVADEADSATGKLLSSFLDPFFMEQMDSENELHQIIAKASDMEGTPGLLRQLDSEMGGKVAE